MNSPEPSGHRLTGVFALGGAATLFFGKLGITALTLLSTAILARLLAPQDFGVLAGALVVTALADAIFEGAFGIGMVQRRNVDTAYASSNLTLSLALAVIICGSIVLASPLIEAFFGFEHLAGILTLTSTTILFKAIGSPSRSLLQRQHRFRALAMIAFVAYLVGNCLVAVPLAYFGWGSWALAIGISLGAALEGLGTWFAARIPFRLRVSREHISDIAETSGLFTIAQVLNWAANGATNVIVGKFLGAVDLGLYSRSWKLLSVAIATTATPVSRVLLPAFSRRQDDLASARRGFITALSISLPVYGAASLACVLHAQAIVDLALGAKWSGAVPIVQLLFLALLPRSAYKVSESVAYGFGRSGGATIRQAIYAGLMIGSALIGVQFGATGVAASSAVAVTTFYVISVSYACDLLAVPMTSILRLHLVSGLILVPATMADLLVVYLSEPLPFWTGQFLGLSAFALVCSATFAAIPASVVGSNFTEFRAQLLAFLRQRMTKDRIPSSS